MALHLIKLCVGCDSVGDLRDWIREKLQEKKRRSEVDLHDRVPQFDRCIFERRPLGARGVVHHHVDAAETIDREPHQPPAGVDVGEIGGGGHRAAANRGCHGARLRLIASVHDHPRADRGEVLGTFATRTQRPRTVVKTTREVSSPGLSGRPSSHGGY